MDTATETRLVQRLDRLEAGVSELLAILRAGPAAGRRGARKAPAAAKLRTVPVSEFLGRAAVTLRTFDRNYSHLFTDRRPLDRRGRGHARLLMADEVDLFFSDGPEAVQNYRRRTKRL